MPSGGSGSPPIAPDSPESKPSGGSNEGEIEDDDAEITLEESTLRESNVIVRNFKGSGASHVYADRKSTNLGKNPFQDKNSENQTSDYSGPVKISKAFRKS